MDYIIRYTMLKTMRTLVPVTIVIAAILVVRKIIDTVCSKKNPVPWLYVKTYMWFLLLPAAFMGGLKLSLEQPTLRSRLYVFFIATAWYIRSVGGCIFSESSSWRPCFCSVG